MIIFKKLSGICSLVVLEIATGLLQFNSSMGSQCGVASLAYAPSDTSSMFLDEAPSQPTKCKVMC